ncbi:MULTISPECIES: hypothetical protein [unclassified Pseudomonas]|uniref:hypothetical protein n=1 Tax=unclassified Pseudomonas TaxID=196821 RepID=UPI000A1DD3BC|nr:MULTISPECIES: hypothetical protein [unclassified Pseudomonas]
MSEKYRAVIIEIDPVVEEAVLIFVEGYTVRCFAGSCPIALEVGQTYDVELEMVLPDEGGVSAADCEKKKIEMKGSGFSCELSGRLDGAVFRSFVDFSDQDIHYEHPDLNGLCIKVSVERIDASFWPT